MSLKKNLQSVIKASPNKRIFFFDESRFGTHSKVGHGWFVKGSRSPVNIKLGFQNFYLYSAVEPRSGDSCSFVLPYVDTKCMNLFLDEFAKTLDEEEVIIIMDGAGWHKSQELMIPSNVQIMYLPPYSPELNPVERLWLYIKKAVLYNRIYDNLGELEDVVCDFVVKLTRNTLSTVCAISYMTS